MHSSLVLMQRAVVRRLLIQQKRGQQSAKPVPAAPKEVTGTQMLRAGSRKVEGFRG